jgi:Ca-activated chloride channel family protein
MSINYDDPKWTAYVLGELNESERAMLEFELESSEEAREFVRELRHAVFVVKEGLAAHPDPALTAEQRGSVRQAALTRGPRRRFIPALAWAGGLVAALFVVAILYIPTQLRSRQAAQEVRFIPPPDISIPASQPSNEISRQSKDAQAPPVQTAQASLKKQSTNLRDAEADLQNAGTPKVESQIAAGVAGGVYTARAEALAVVAPPPVPAAAPAPPGSPPPSSLSASAAVALDRFDRFNRFGENPFLAANEQPLATFSVDVDTASYANVRRFLNLNQWPPQESIRLEEMINYFTYDYPQASGGQAVTGNLEVAAAPWNPQHRLVRVGVKAKDLRLAQKSSNLVFLIDVSGSMGTPERLPLLKNGLHLLVDKLTESDRVSIVTYAGASGIALAPISGDRKDVILRVIDNLHAEGNTNGGAGIQTAYEMAVSNFIPGSVNRVILATDGDFNVGITDPNQLTQMIEARARSGVFLTVLGFGNNFKDSMLGRLAEKGHGNYAFIDTLDEARKVLVEQIDATLVAVARDVKVQVEFNPSQVNAYRLLGYESRIMPVQDFNNDRKDANDMGSGQTVTALFEVVPNAARTASQMLDLKIRYKDPESTESKLFEMPLVDRGTNFANASSDFRFASAVAGFGMILRDSQYKGSATLDWILATAQNSRSVDKNGYREEFVRLVQRAMELRR